MKQWLKGLAMCQSMFCAVPCPWNVWDENAREKMILCLPLVGLEMGLLWFCTGWICHFLKLPTGIIALALALFPFLISGFIHLDGFMDVTDAVKSYRSLERRREILKDSHVGSFAVIGVILLILSQYVFCAAAAPDADLRILILIPAVSRCCSVLAVNRLPKMETSQYAETGSRSLAPICLLIVFLILGFLLGIKAGLCLVGGILGYLLALRKAYRSLQGMNGDISGYALTYSELAALAVLALL